MWLLYYKNIERINQLAAQIQTEVVTEKTERKKRRASATGKANGGINLGVISKIFNPNLSLEGKSEIDSELDTEQKIEYNTQDVQLNNVLEKFKKLKLTIIDENCKIEDVNNVTEIIRFKGYCCPIVKGGDYSERLANYEKIVELHWSCRIKNLRISFKTNKKSIVSNTPIHTALEDTKGKLFLDGYGAVVYKNANSPKYQNVISIKIIPIIIGTKLNL